MKYRFVKKKKKQPRLLTSLLSLRPLVQGPDPDFKLLLCVLGLIVFGWVMVYSSSALFAESRYQDQFYFLKRQILWTLIGILPFLAAMNIPLSFWQKNVKLIFGATLISLVLVLIIGPEIAGARRWIRLGVISFQPSELAKFTMILVVADYLDRRQSRLREFKKGLLPVLGLSGSLIFLIFLEPDLGTPVLMGGVLLSLLVLGGARIRHLIGMAGALLPFLAMAILMVRYRLDRFFAYLNPWSDPHGSGYQLVQSLLAMGSGGIFGRGLGNSRIKVAHLPDAHTDFVFSVLGEELGLLGTLVCIILFVFIVVRGLKIAKRAQNTFSMLTAAGISLMIGFQGIINMGVASGMFPTKGMPLPFISFGGSSLVITLMGIGVLANISKQKSPTVKGNGV